MFLVSQFARATSSSNTYRRDGVDRTIIRLNRYRSTSAKCSNFCVSTRCDSIPPVYFFAMEESYRDRARLSPLGPSSSCDFSLSFALFPRAIVMVSRSLYIALQNSSYCDEIHLMGTDRYISSSVSARNPIKEWRENCNRRCHEING